MAACGFYRGSGAAWQQALPPALEKIEDGGAVRQRCWELLPQDAWREPLRACQVVSCGLSPRSSLTLSSLAQRRVLCVQRQLTALDDTLMEPQDIPLPAAWDCWETEHLLLLAGAYLLLGRL